MGRIRRFVGQGVLGVVVILSPLFAVSSAARGDESGEALPHVVIDARELPRKLLSATITFPLEDADADRRIALWYPKWVPGSHGPGGAIENIAGLVFTDEQNRVLTWTRTPGEVYRLQVDVPAEAKQLQLRVRYIANQPSTNSMGHDVFGSALVGVISPSAILFYREQDRIDETKIVPTLRLPRGWKASTALQANDAESSAAPETIEYLPTTLRTLVDSPIMCGCYRRIYALNKESAEQPFAPHRLHVFADSSKATELNAEIVTRLESMVAQTGKLMRAYPFDQFEILLAATDQLPANGLEHARSSLNVLPPDKLKTLGTLKGWHRLLIPHEYLHAWCGKYRRPAGMLTETFHEPKGTDLLWVYEGLTQYLGELIEARCGLMSHDEFRHRLGVELRNAHHQQNRSWRPLVDTAAASHVLRAGSPAWPRLRGSQDYYMEGMLLWLEIDALLRLQSDGTKSLDDFCQSFFSAGDDKATAESSRPKPFTREEVVSTLNELSAFDWDGLIRRRVELPYGEYDASVAGLLGYRFEYTEERPEIPGNTFRSGSGVDELDTVGASFSPEGLVKDVLLGSVADRAKLGPGMKVLGIHGRTWSSQGFRDAIRESANSPSIDLLVNDGDLMKHIQLQYYDGPNYLSLVRDEAQVDLLEMILEAKP